MFLMKTLTASLLAIVFVSSPLMAKEVIPTPSGEVTMIPLHHASFLLKQKDYLVAVDPVGDPAEILKHGKPDLVSNHKLLKVCFLMY